MDSNDSPPKTAGLSFYVALIVFSLISLVLPSVGLALLLISGFNIYEHFFLGILILSVICQLMCLKFLKER
jgi:hypothetical protein